MATTANTNPTTAAQAASPTPQTTGPWVGPTRGVGAVVGFLVFLAGLALVFYVFNTARGLFEAPTAPIPAVPPAGSAVKPDQAAMLTGISQSLVDFLKKLLLLLVMCISGSFISWLGIKMFFNACAATLTRP